MRLRELLEGSSVLSPEIENTISPTMIIPELINSDTYKQYRYTLALASALAVKAGEVPFDAESAWNESLAAVAYSPEELEIIELANRMMNVKGKMLSKSPSSEPNDTQTDPDQASDGRDQRRTRCC
jgi:hypothetical protein